MEHHSQGQGKGQGRGQGQSKGHTSGHHPPSPPPTHHEQCLASDRLKEESLVEMIRLRKGDACLLMSVVMSSLLDRAFLWHALLHILIAICTC